MKVSIVVVSYNTRDLTLACLRSVFAETTAFPFEVIVVDNASSDGSADAIAAELPGVKLVALEENVGFARANNLASGHATGEYLLLLNPDTEVLDRAVEELVAFADAHPEASVWGGRTLFADRSLNRGSCWGAPTPWSLFCHGSGLASLFRHSRLFDPESLGRWPRDTERDVDVVSGCFLLVRRTTWTELGGFDPAFFMYGEDADLCLRAGRCRVTPRAAIVHHGGASEPVRADKMVRLFSAKALLFKKHWSRASARFGVRMLDAWAFTRMAAFGLFGWARPGGRRSFEEWRSVWRRRRAWREAFEGEA